MTRTPITIALSAAALVIGTAAATIYLTRAAEPAVAPAPASTAAAATAAPKAAGDPYAAYLKLAPAKAPNLSREDAQARALLGCAQTWAPGTVDAALAEAYADLCKQAK